MAKRRLEGFGAVEVYVSEAGFICLKQDNYADDDSVVCLPAEQVETIVNWLYECVAERKEALEENPSAFDREEASETSH